MRILLLMNGSRERYAGGADEARYRRWLEYCSPETELSLGHLPSEKESGGISKSYEFGTGNAVKLGALYPDRCAQAEAEGFDAVVIHCCADPGLQEVRKKVKIPVVGPGEVTLRACAMVGRKIGITVPGSESVEHHWEQAHYVGLGSLVVGIEPVNLRLGEFSKQDPRAMTQSVIEAAKKLVARGADVIFPSGLAFIPTRVWDREVSVAIGTPVLNPAFIALKTAEMLVRAVQSGKPSP